VSEAFDRLTALVSRLRRDCPWDREQSFETLRTYLLEETYEVLAAVDAGEAEELREELGDLLFQVFFLACLAQERGWFGIEAVAEGITRKMTERHPHVFGDAKASTAEEVKSAWEKRKRQLPGATEDPLGTLPAALPALAAAYRQTLRAADLGFDWERDADVVAKIEEEMAEWKEAAAASDAEAEAPAGEDGRVAAAPAAAARAGRLGHERVGRRGESRTRRRPAPVATARRLGAGARAAAPGGQVGLDGGLPRTGGALP